MSALKSTPAYCGTCWTRFTNVLVLWTHLDQATNRCPRSTYGRQYGPNVHREPDYESAPARQPRDTTGRDPRADYELLRNFVLGNPGVDKTEAKERLGWTGRRIFSVWIRVQNELNQKEAA